MNVFQVGETVIANMTAQGMTEGEKYTVIGVSSFPTSMGVFYDYKIYSLSERKKSLDIRNGHIILCKANCKCHSQKGI